MMRFYHPQKTIPNQVSLGIYTYFSKIDKILGLREKGLRRTLLLPIGYKNATKDWLVNLVKVRKPMKELVTFIK